MVLRKRVWCATGSASEPPLRAGDRIGPGLLTPRIVRGVIRPRQPHRHPLPPLRHAPRPDAVYVALARPEIGRESRKRDRLEEAREARGCRAVRLHDSHRDVVLLGVEVGDELLVLLDFALFTLLRLETCILFRVPGHRGRADRCRPREIDEVVGALPRCPEPEVETLRLRLFAREAEANCTIALAVTL